ncbi:hypothetical protein TNCV_2318471 [Trichonephila clavipes]|nr:hypothetical protein TNCV_2318471 [Trichonephila clavipes]
MSERSRLSDSSRRRVVGWMEMGWSQPDAAKYLNVSLSVVTVSRINIKPKHLSVQKTCSRPTTSYNTCRRPSFSLFRPEGGFLCRNLLQTTLQHQGEEYQKLR